MSSLKKCNAICSGLASVCTLTGGSSRHSAGTCRLTSGNLLDDVKKVVADKLGVDIGTVTAQSRIEDFDVDMNEAIQLAMALATTFGVNVSMSDVAKIQTVQDMVDFVETHSN